MSLSRRNFLKTSAIGVAALSASNLPRVHAGEDNLIKVALIGCGGRGRGAAANTLNADPNSKIVAVADAFMPKAKGAVEGLEAAFGDREQVRFEIIVPALVLLAAVQLSGHHPRRNHGRRPISQPVLQLKEVPLRQVRGEG